MTGYYICIGSVRRSCRVHHKTLEAAQKHIEQDSRGCKTQGGYSDREVYFREPDSNLIPIPNPCWDKPEVRE